MGGCAVALTCSAEAAGGGTETGGGNGADVGGGGNGADVCAGGKGADVGAGGKGADVGAGGKGADVGNGRDAGRGADGVLSSGRVGGGGSTGPDEVTAKGSDCRGRRAGIVKSKSSTGGAGSGTRGSFIMVL